LSRLYDDETGGHGGDLTRAAKRWDQGRDRLIDFSSNVNPLGPPEGLLEYLSETLPEIVHYPSPQARELRENLSCFLGLPGNRIIASNGANELIHLLALWKRPRRVFVPAPTFSEYERAARLVGARVERFPLPPGENFDPGILNNRISSGDLVVFCNPSNPTGMLYDRKGLLDLVRVAEKQGALVMIDESFIPLTGQPEQSLRHKQSGNLWIALSLTKLWALPGLRLGVLIGPESEISELTRWGDPWRVNIMAQKAGLYCLSREGYLEESLDLIEKERRFLIDKLEATGGLRVFAGAANYLLARATVAGFDVAECQDALARRGVLIRRADNFHGLDRRYLRVAVLNRPENIRLAEEMETYIKKLRADHIEEGEQKRHEKEKSPGGEG